MERYTCVSRPAIFNGVQKREVCAVLAVPLVEEVAALGDLHPEWTASDLRVAKITGRKVFASDYRASDLSLSHDWPADCAHALILRATCVTKRFKEINVSSLSLENRPTKVITADDIHPKQDGPEARYPLTIGGKAKFICPPGQIPDYLSQPLAILLYDDFLTFRRASQELREDRGIVLYEDVPLSSWAANPPLEGILLDWRGLNADAALSRTHFLFSSALTATPSSQYRDGALSYAGNSWTRSVVDPSDPNVAAKASANANAVYSRLTKMVAGPRCVETTSFTQQIDPSFLEPECGLGYVDKDGLLTILVGTQSSFKDARGPLRDIITTAKSRATKLNILAVDPGGGFGGRDASPFMVQIAFAAIFSDKPVRLAYDRFEQFQAGLKRHGVAVHSLVSATDDGTLDQAFVHSVFEGAAEPNLGNPVMQLGSLHATGFYKFRQAGVHGLLTRRSVPIVGSMRGFGIPQVNFNIEIAVDKLAVKLGRDPIEFRRANVLRHNPDPGAADCDLAGTPLRFHVANAEVCDAALTHSLWSERDQVRDEWAARGIHRGVGFAGCMEAYGTSGDSQYAAIQLDADGGITVWSETVDMGQGARRSVACVVASIFHVEPKIALGAAGPFESFVKLVSPIVDTPDGIKRSDHPSASASKTAFFHVHVVRQAAEALIRFRILPALREMTGTSLAASDIRSSWDATGFLINDRRIELGEVAKHMAANGWDRLSIVHGWFANGWAKARFVEGSITHEAFVDSIGFAVDDGAAPKLVDTETGPQFPIGKGPGGVTIPRSGYATGAHLIAVEIDPKAASIKVTDVVAFLDAGEPIVESILDGQIEGGMQMGISHALFEELPPESGQDRYVNFDRYVLPRAFDITPIRLEKKRIPLPPAGALNDLDAYMSHKGVGEVTMTTVAAAISNAVAHALRHHSEDAWPCRLPIRFADLRLAEAPSA